jgi:hypothetical protein
MNIYDYLRSRDVAAYCREINKTWNTFEMAIIIGRSDRTMAEKHKAWLELINNFPDMPTPPDGHINSFDSIHKKLGNIMDYEDHVFELFKKPESGAIYIYSARSVCNKKYNPKNVFSFYEKALNDAKDSYERDEAHEIYIERIFIDDNDNCSGRIEGLFDYDGNLLDLSFYGDNKEIRTKLFPKFNSLKEIGDTFSTFTEYYYIDIPAPFKSGDILIGNSIRLGKTPVFVHDVLSRDDPKILERYLKGESGDGSDLTGWGFFVSENGVLYGDHTYDHDSFEYFKRELKGKDRLLHYVSLYLKKEIGLPELLAMQNRIMLEHQLNNNLPINSHGCYIPEHLLAQEEKDMINRINNTDD